MSHTKAAMPVSGKKEQVNLRLTDQARRILQDLASKMGVSQADVLEILLREEKKRDSGIIERK